MGGTRRYNFLQAFTTSTSPDPAAPSADGDVVTKGYTDDTYAQRSSWYDKAADNDAIRAIVSADRSLGQIVFNYGTSLFYTFDSASALADDDDMVLQPDAGTGRWLRATSSATGGSSSSIIQELDQQVATFLNGEAIADRDAVCIEIHNGSGSDELKFFKADANVGNRRSFAGFALAAVSATPNIKTYTISAAYVSGNVIPIVINGRSYGTTYASSSDATLQALATAIATDQDVTSAVVTVVGGNQTGTDDRVITITSKGSLLLNITGTTVTGGASQPTITVAQTQAAIQNPVDLHERGPLDGFTSLVVGDKYYLSDTAGGITNTPSTGLEILLGAAISTTQLMVGGKEFGPALWGTSQVYLRSHGSSTGADAGVVQDVEHYNGGAWSSGTPSTLGARAQVSASDSSFNNKHHVLDGTDSASNIGTLLFQIYNKASWSSGTNRATGRSGSGGVAFNGFFTSSGGQTTASAASQVTTYDKWSGSSWSTGTAWANAYAVSGFFTYGSQIYQVGGQTTASGITNSNQSKNTSDTESGNTVLPVSSFCTGAISPSSKGMVNATASGANGTGTYEWAGSWSSAIAATYSQLPYNAHPAFWLNRNVFIQNGGQTGGVSGTVNTTTQYNGSAFSAGTSSSNSRGRGVGSVA